MFEKINIFLTNDVVSFEQLGQGSYSCHSDIGKGVGITL